MCGLRGLVCIGVSLGISFICKFGWHLCIKQCGLHKFYFCKFGSTVHVSSIKRQRQNSGRQCQTTSMTSNHGIRSDVSDQHYNAHWSGTLCEHTIYIHLLTHLIPTSQWLGYWTDTSCNFPHKPTVCNTGTGFILRTATFLKHFKLGRAAATTSPAPNVSEWHFIFHNYHM